MSVLACPLPTTTILMPGDPGWDDARRAWNLAVDQHPAAIALPASAHDVVVVIAFRPPSTACGSPRRAPATTPRRSARWPTPSWSRPSACAR